MQTFLNNSSRNVIIGSRRERPNEQTLYRINAPAWHCRLLATTSVTRRAIAGLVAVTITGTTSTSRVRPNDAA